MKLEIGKNSFNVKVVATPTQTQEGMMKKRFNDSFNGMLFLMNSGEHCFWMKNCIISLDIIFISENKITKIYHNCPPCYDNECENYCGNGNIVLEILGGSARKLGISEDDVIKF